MTIKAITIYQPYATLIAIGAKRIETRSWSPQHIGPIAIHAGMNRSCMGLAIEEPFRSCLARAGIGFPSQFPMGCIVAMARLAGTDPTEGIRDKISEQERAFGDYGNRRFGWLLEHVQPLKTPIMARGEQGLWDWKDPPPGLLESYLREIGGSRSTKAQRPMADARDE